MSWWLRNKTPTDGNGKQTLVLNSGIGLLFSQEDKLIHILYTFRLVGRALYKFLHVYLKVSKLQIIPSVSCNRGYFLDVEHPHPRMEKTMVFSFNTPTLEHQCECTYMQTAPYIAFLQVKLELSFSCMRARFWHCNSPSKSFPCPLSPCSTFSIRTVWPRQAVLCKLLRWTFSHPKYVFFFYLG